MHIGLIGGIGPAATVVYYQSLVAQMRARGLPLEITLVQAEASDLVRNNREDNRDAQAAIYAGLIDRLKAAGAQCAAITSIGGHFCFEQTLRLSSLPLISAISPLDAFFASQGLTKIGLLGTVGVMRSKLYGQLDVTEAVAPQDALDTIGQTYS
ncbi:MAG: aspartate racemase, partial [Sulfitobacter sp.]